LGLVFPLFDSVARPTETKDEMDDDCFYLRVPSKGVDGQGVYTSEGFVVFDGSTGSLENAPSIGESSARARQKLIDLKVMATHNQDQLIFQKDHLFSSPSSAATAVLGRRANGWTKWKDSKGRTLHQVKREPGS
jgi:hypothetical protein